MQLPDFLRYPKLSLQLKAFNCDDRDKRGVKNFSNRVPSDQRVCESFRRYVTKPILVLDLRALDNESQAVFTGHVVLACSDTTDSLDENRGRTRPLGQELHDGQFHSAKIIPKIYFSSGAWCAQFSPMRVPSWSLRTIHLFGVATDHTKKCC